MERAISQRSDETTLAATLARDVPRLRASDSLEDAVHALGATDDEGVPVTGEHDQLIGWLTHRRVLRAYQKRFGQPRATRTEPTPMPAPPTEVAGSPTPSDPARR